MQTIQRYIARTLPVLLWVSSALGQVPFSTVPNWRSADSTNYSTGIAWADLNNDGWLDLVVANGNDMARQRLVVYYNSDGTIPRTPDWQSADIDYHGHLAVGDVNKDGFIDVAVSVYIGAAGFSQKGRVKLYLNNNGTLSSSPVWTSRDSIYTFSCAFGDANGDGWLELAVACGESYYNRSEYNRIYYNTAGRLDSLPRWKSSTAGYSYDVGWADFDNDGDLDLVFANERGPNRMYTNFGDSIGTIATWSSTDPSQFANSLSIADVNNDAYLDLAISDNNQLGGSGRFKIYLNNAGILSTTPFWSSAFSGYGSGITLADIDNDGDKDLITGGWWQPLRIYVNNGETFPTVPDWTSSTNSVVEAIVFGDCDNDGLDAIILRRLGDGLRKLFYFPRSPLHTLLHVVVGNDTLGLTQYSCDLENGWVYLATAPQTKVLITFVAIVSSDLDFAVSNWDPTIGNYIFHNLTPPVSVHQVYLPEEIQLLQNFPNPFNPRTVIRYQMEDSRWVTLKVYNLLGQEVAVLVNEQLPAGYHSIVFDASAIPSGVYVYRLNAGSFTDTKKLIVLK